MLRSEALTTLLLATSKHHIAGIVVIVVGAVLAIYGALRAFRRVGGAALLAVAGVVIVVIGVLLFTRTIGG